MHCPGLKLSGGTSAFHHSGNTAISGGRSPADPKSVVSPATFIYYSKRTHFQPSLPRIRATIGEEIVSPASFYELLGVSDSGTSSEIKKAYKQLARKYHPDVSPEGRAQEYTERFIRVHEAYETLSDPRRRASYDRDMARGLLHLAFSARRRYEQGEEIDDKREWKNHWRDQVSKLKRRSINKDCRGNMSWGAQMRAQRSEEKIK